MNFFLAACTKFLNYSLVYVNFVFSRVKNNLQHDLAQRRKNLIPHNLFFFLFFQMLTWIGQMIWQVAFYSRLAFEYYFFVKSTLLYTYYIFTYIFLREMN